MVDIIASEQVIVIENVPVTSIDPRDETVNCCAVLSNKLTFGWYGLLLQFLKPHVRGFVGPENESLKAAIIVGVDPELMFTGDKAGTIIALQIEQLGNCVTTTVNTKDELAVTVL